MKKKGIRRTVRLSIVAALYVVLTLIFSFISYGDIQFRIAEILIILCFFKKDYSFSIIVGCLISNLFSPMGLADVAFGTFATILSVVCIAYSKKMWLTIIYPTVFNGVIIGLELFIFLKLPLIPSMICVALGEVTVLVVGYLIFAKLKSNAKFMELIEAK